MGVTDSEPVPVTVTQDLSVTVGESGTFAITSTSVPGATNGLAYSTKLTAVGGVGPYSWSLTSGTLPAGLTLDPGGAISGTPTAVGTSTVSVQVTDASVPTPQSLTATLSIIVGVDGPAAQVAASPSSGVAPFSAGLVVTANQLNSDLLTYTVDFGDGSNPSQGTLVAPYDPITLTHTYTSPGSFVASVDVVDSVTGLSSVTTTNVEAAATGVEAPTATLDATPSSGVAPLTTSLQVGGSDPGGLP